MDGANAKEGGSDVEVLLHCNNKGLSYPGIEAIFAMSIDDLRTL